MHSTYQVEQQLVRHKCAAVLIKLQLPAEFRTRADSISDSPSSSDLDSSFKS
jgi:hypothetical protein